MTATAPPRADPVLEALERLDQVAISFPDGLHSPGEAAIVRYGSATLGDWKLIRDVLPIAVGLAKRTRKVELELVAARDAFQDLERRTAARLAELEKLIA